MTAAPAKHGTTTTAAGPCRCSSSAPVVVDEERHCRKGGRLAAHRHRGVVCMRSGAKQAGCSQGRINKVVPLSARRQAAAIQVSHAAVPLESCTRFRVPNHPSTQLPIHPPTRVPRLPIRRHVLAQHHVVILDRPDAAQHLDLARAQVTACQERTQSRAGEGRKTGRLVAPPSTAWHSWPAHALQRCPTFSSRMSSGWMLSGFSMATKASSCTRWFCGRQWRRAGKGGSI